MTSPKKTFWNLSQFNVYLNDKENKYFQNLNVS